MVFERENIPRIKPTGWWRWYLLPGQVIQWFLYMFPSGRYSRVVSDTRQARSPLMTYVYSTVFYFMLLAGFGYLVSVL